MPCTNREERLEHQRFKEGRGILFSSSTSNWKKKGGREDEKKINQRGGNEKKKSARDLVKTTTKSDIYLEDTQSKLAGLRVLINREENEVTMERNRWHEKVAYA
jgi:hypothetical protein